MENYTKSIIDFLKLQPRYLLPIIIGCSTILFIPEQYARLFGLAETREIYRHWIGLALIISGSIFIIAIATNILNLTRKFFAKKAYKSKLIKKLKNLTEDEKKILRYYFAKETKINVLRQHDGNVSLLEQSNVIHRASKTGSILSGFPFAIDEIALKYLIKNYNLLQGTTNEYITHLDDFDPLYR